MFVTFVIYQGRRQAIKRYSVVFTCALINFQLVDIIAHCTEYELIIWSYVMYEEMETVLNYIQTRKNLQTAKEKIINKYCIQYL